MLSRDAPDLSLAWLVLSSALPSPTAAKAQGGGLAIVLHGKVGGMHSLTTPGGAMRAVDGARASAPMMAMCYASLLQHIVQPNQRRGMHVDIFGHSLRHSPVSEHQPLPSQIARLHLQPTPCRPINQRVGPPAGSEQCPACDTCRFPSLLPRRPPQLHKSFGAVSRGRASLSAWRVGTLHRSTGLSPSAGSSYLASLKDLTHARARTHQVQSKCVVPFFTLLPRSCL